jgi:hypothetical protein
MADHVDKGMLMIEQHHVPPGAALFVMSLVKVASRTLLSAEGYQVERALAVLDQWLENAGERAALGPPSSMMWGSGMLLRAR